MKEAEKSLDPQLWHTCTGGMDQMPPMNSKVFYFPQGHAEHAQTHVDFPSSIRVAALILCRVAGIRYMADPDSDEVFARIRLVPCVSTNEVFEASIESDVSENTNADKPSSFAKTLTQSDANNGGGFSVPRYCAETIFPRLDYSADPPVQTVIAKDVHGEVWKFRHIYRGTPRRHLLTTGWSTFVNHKKLVASDSIVFLQGENGDLCVGIRRAKRGFPDGVSPESSSTSSSWNHGGSGGPSLYSGFSVFLKDEENKTARNGFGNSSPKNNGMVRGGGGRVRPEDVVEAATLAVNAQPFEVVYYPRASTPEFCVKAAAVKTAVRVQWCSAMRFKMAFETEDSSRVSWFMGTISSIQVYDQIRWPNSPWRLLQVTWDEPDMLRNVKCVSPWLIKLVSNFPMIHMVSPFSPPQKKLCIPQHPDFTLDGQLTLPPFSGNPLGSSSPMCCLPDNTPAGIQGARHAQLRISLSNLHFDNKLQSGLFSSSFQRFDQNSRIPNGIRNGHTSSNEIMSCLLTMGSANQNLEKSDNVKKHQFLLFGQPILTEQQINRSCSSDAVSQVLTGKNQGRKKFLSIGSDSALEHWNSLERSALNKEFHAIELDTRHCKVFMESEDVGRTLDLSALGSYDELYRRLIIMFRLEKPEMLSHVLYKDPTGVVKQTGDEPFSEFKKTAKRMTILTRPANETIGSTWVRGMGNAETGLGASNKTGPLSIFA